MIGIVSTFSDKNYEDYAYLLVECLNKHVDKRIKISLYTDNVKFTTNSNISCIPFEQTVPDLADFKKRNKHREVPNFMHDGVRFSHKVYAIWHASQNLNVEKLFWLDADTIIQKPVDEEYFKKFLPNDYFTSYLGRPQSYTECGFLGFDLQNIYSTQFFSEMIDYYNSDRIYTDLPYQTDCHVYDAVRSKFESTKKIKALDLTPGIRKSNFNFLHKGYMIHNKGQRKFKNLKGTT